MSFAKRKERKIDRERERERERERMVHGRHNSEVNIATNRYTVGHAERLHNYCCPLSLFDESNPDSASPYSANPRAEDAAGNENVFAPVRRRDCASFGGDVLPVFLVERQSSH